MVRTGILVVLLGIFGQVFGLTTNYWDQTTTSYRYYDTTPYTNCGRTHYSTLNGGLTSPNYPFNYSNNAYCEYIIQTSVPVYLKVMDLDLENCCDSLKIYDQHGIENNASSFDYLYGNYFRVVFRTDGSVTRRGYNIEWSRTYPTRPPPTQYFTFESTYSIHNYCDQTLNSDSGVMNNYDTTWNCTVTIRPSTPVILTVDHINLDPSSQRLKIEFITTMHDKNVVTLTGSNKGGEMIGQDFVVSFTTLYPLTNQGFQLSWNRDQRGQTTNGWRWFTTQPWWRYTTAQSDSVHVYCSAYDMNVVVPLAVIRRIFPNVSPYDLTLNDPNCKGQVYSDSVNFNANILGCGMRREETRYDVLYLNRIIPKSSQSTPYPWYTTPYPWYTTTNSWWYTSEAPVVYYDVPGIDLECRLQNYVTAVGHYRPVSNQSLYAYGRGNYSVYMNFYHDYSYNYRITSYPLSIGLNEDVYVDLELSGQDSNLRIAARRCYAQPTDDNHYPVERHYLIKDGCPVEANVAFEYASGPHVHFRFRAFEFLKSRRNVFIFCDVNICNDTDYNNRCQPRCYHRRRRSPSKEETHDLNIFQGPLTFRTERSAELRDSAKKNWTSSSSFPAVVMAISAVAMVIAAVVIVAARRFGRSKTRLSVNDETVKM